MTTPVQPAQPDHLGQAVAAVGDQLVEDAIAHAKAHPAWEQAVIQLSEKALGIVLGAIGIGV